MSRRPRSLHGLRGLLRALSLGFFPRVLWHMHSLGVILCMSLLFVVPAPFLYTYAFLHYAVGKGKERRAFFLLALEAFWPIGEGRKIYMYALTKPHGSCRGSGGSDMHKQIKNQNRDIKHPTA